MTTSITPMIIYPADRRCRAASKSRRDKMAAPIQAITPIIPMIPMIPIIPMKQTALKRQIAHIDNQIDQLTYELYNLTEQEIKIIEDAAAQ